MLGKKIWTLGALSIYAVMGSNLFADNWAPKDRDCIISCMKEHYCEKCMNPLCDNPISCSKKIDHCMPKYTACVEFKCQLNPSLLETLKRPAYWACDYIASGNGIELEL